MYLATAPPHRDLPAPPLYLRRAARRRFSGPAAVAAEPGHHARLREYVADLARPYGVPLREHAFTGAEGHSYGEMGAALIRTVVPPEEPVDLLVLAFAVPDIRPGRATATYLSEVCPGAPFAFAITDQGTAAAYTGLRLVREYARGGGCQRAVLLVLEQAGRHYGPADGVPAGWPSTHCGVALVYEPSGPAGPVEVRQHPDVGPEELDRLLAAEVADLTAGWSGGLTLVLGPGIAGSGAAVADRHLTADRVRAAPAGQPATGGWWELAGELSGEPDPAGAPGLAASPRRVVLADYEPALRYLSLSAADRR